MKSRKNNRYGNNLLFCGFNQLSVKKLEIRVNWKGIELDRQNLLIRLRHTEGVIDLLAIHCHGNCSFVVVEESEQSFTCVKGQ